MFCGKCGSLVPDGNSFCSNCGAPVDNPAINAPKQIKNQPVPIVPSGRPVKRRNGMATAGLVFGIIAIVISFQILTDVGSDALGYIMVLIGAYGTAILGVVFSSVGVGLSHKRDGLGRAVFGLLFSILGFFLPWLLIGLSNYK